MTAARMTTAEILRGSLELLEDPDHWTQGVNARDEAGNEAIPWDPHARRWCMEGALRKIAGSPAIAECSWVLRKALPRDWYGSADKYNDEPGRQHGEVLDVYRRALARAEAEEAA